MLTEDYFKKKHIDIYELSPIKYLNGVGCLSDGSTEIKTEWELNVSISGVVSLVLTSSEFIFDPNIKGRFIIRSLKGEYIDPDGKQFKIDVEELFIYGHRSEDSHNTYFCGFKSINIKQAEEIKAEKIVGYISNYHFSGRSFSTFVNNRKFHFLQYEKDKELIDLFDQKGLHHAFFSVIITSVESSANEENIINTIDNLSYLLSFFSMNMTVVPLFKFFKDNKLTAIKIRNLKLLPFIKNQKILDSHIKNRIKNGIEQCYDRFVAVKEQLSLGTLFNGLIAMMVQPYIDLKIAILLISYELLLTKYLISEGGFKEPDIRELSIQDKLRKINSRLKFISKKFLKDDLRTNIRNPLFHLGELTFISPIEAHEVFKTYWGLLIEIILRILNYKGEFLEPDSDEIKNII